MLQKKRRRKTDFLKSILQKKSVEICSNCDLRKFFFPPSSLSPSLIKEKLVICSRREEDGFSLLPIKPFCTATFPILFLSLAAPAPAPVSAPVSALRPPPRTHSKSYDLTLNFPRLLRSWAIYQPHPHHPPSTHPHTKKTNCK